jgi:hypothetical protein
MKTLAVAIILSIVASGCTSTASKRYPHPVIAEFIVPDIGVGPIRSREAAEKVASAYFREFDDSGSIQFRSEQTDRWIFTARVGDFVAVPVSDIVVSKDGSFIMQSGVAPVVRKVSERWLYDKREERQIQWDLDPANPENRMPKPPPRMPVSGTLAADGAVAPPSDAAGR